MEGWQRTHFRQDGKTTIVETWQDCEAIVEHNKRLQSDNVKSDWGRPIAEIPNVIVVKWLQEEWNRGNTGLRYLSKEWKELVRRKLRDPDWMWLRSDNKSNPFFSGWRQ